MAPTSPTRLRSRNESFPIRNERANQTFSCCTISRRRERRGGQWTVYLCLRLSRKSLSLAVLPSVRCAPALLFTLLFSFRFLASISAARFFFAILFLLMYSCQPENRLEKCSVSISTIRLPIRKKISRKCYFLKSANYDRPEFFFFISPKLSLHI